MIGTTRLFACTLLLAAGSIDPAHAQSATQPIPISLTTQQWCDGFLPGSGCTSGATHAFSADNGAGFTVAGSLTAQNVDGKLVYTVSGTVANTSGSQAFFGVSGHQVVSFAVPLVSAGGSPLPTTAVAVHVARDSSAASEIDTRQLMFTRQGPLTTSSATLGSLSLDELTDLSVGTFDAEIVKLDELVGGDQIGTTLTPIYHLVVEPNTSGSFEDSFTFELQYVPSRKRR